MTALVDKAHDHITQLFLEELPTTCLYHNLVHTKRVLKSTKETLAETPLTDEQKEIIHIAVLFHDTGYTRGNVDHEERSAERAGKWLSAQGMDDTFIAEVKRLIMATRMEAKPKDLMEEVIRDADASHFAKEYFQEASEFLRIELRMQGVKDYSRAEWLEANIDMLENMHRYYTEYAKTNWEPGKQKNLETMRQEQALVRKEKKEKKKQRKKAIKAEVKTNDPDKAIQSVFRVTLRNHIKLSDIADTKANILLSVNAIMISIALTNLIPKLDNPKNAYLMIPTLIFLTFSVLSIIMSILATRPNVTKGRFSREDVTNKKVNLLFFGNFHHMSLEEFQWAIGEMLQDKEYIYSSLTKDLYFLGIVLERKYKLLRITYTIFMIGMVLSTIAFAIAFVSVDTTV
jgi:predicted metal-dependent HD superfamily phosphohydrolase